MNYLIFLLFIFSNFSVYAQGSYDWNEHNNAVDSIDWGLAYYGVLFLVFIVWIVNTVSERLNKVDTKEEYKSSKKAEQKNNESEIKSFKNQPTVVDSISFKDYLKLENQVRDFNYLHIKKGTKVICSNTKGIVISVSQKGAYKTAKVLCEDNTIPVEIIDVNWLQIDASNLIKDEALIIKLKKQIYNYAIKNISIGTVVEHPSKGIGTVISVGKEGFFNFVKCILWLSDFDTLSSKGCPKILFSNGDKCNFGLSEVTPILKILKL
ncbi:MAG: hypothetical protein HOI39_01925 [Flavobacteriales bacterium]|jgi:hypothetical protein|nr:hypothetical protein [Flavobacteriales bacterium]